MVLCRNRRLLVGVALACAAIALLWSFGPGGTYFRRSNDDSSEGSPETRPVGSSVREVTEAEGVLRSLVRDSDGTAVLRVSRAIADGTAAFPDGLEFALDFEGASIWGSRTLSGTQYMWRDLKIPMRGTVVARKRWVDIEAPLISPVEISLSPDQAEYVLEVSVPEAAELYIQCLDLDGVPVGGVPISAWTNSAVAGEGMTSEGGLTAILNYGTVGQLSRVYVGAGPLLPGYVEAPFEKTDRTYVIRRPREWAVSIRVLDGVSRQPVESYGIAAGNPELQSSWNTEIRLRGTHTDGRLRVGQLFDETGVVVVLPKYPEYWPSKPAAVDRESSAREVRTIEVWPTPTISVQVLGIPSDLELDELTIVSWRPSRRESSEEPFSMPERMSELTDGLGLEWLSLIVEEKPLARTEVSLRVPVEESYLLSVFRGDDEVARSELMSSRRSPKVLNWHELEQRVVE